MGKVQFQSTLPVRGATVNLTTVVAIAVISIHAPRAGSDITSPQTMDATGNFNPRSPCGERLSKNINKIVRKKISIHAPRAGSDGMKK